MINALKKQENRNFDISERYVDAMQENDKRRWIFIDLEEHDFQIRQEELRKYMALRARERKSRAWKSCRAVHTRSFPTRSKPALIWQPLQLPAVMC